MGADLLDGDVEITEFEAIEVESIKGVPQGANGFPVLMMKGLAKAPDAAEEEQAGEPAWAHRPFDGTHSHEHPDGDGGTHSHKHEHDGDAAHAAHSHASKSAGPPAWHSPAALLVRLARENQDKAPGDLFKAVNADGAVDEQPDIDGGKQAIALIAKLIGYEAEELAAGELDETSGIGLLTEAVSCLKYWLRGEQAGQAGTDAYGDDGAMDGVVMASTDEEPFIYAADDVAKDSREFSAAERKKHAAAGNALPDGSYPIPDVDALGRAATLARSKHGDWKAARRLIAKRARELGAANPLDDGKDDDTSKSTVAEGEADVQTDPEGTGGLAKAVEDAVTKALEPVRQELSDLRAFKAKVEALPVPGGPVLSAVRATARAEGGDDWAAKAAYYRSKAEQAVNPADRDGYRQLAREATEKAQAANT